MEAGSCVQFNVVANCRRKAIITAVQMTTVLTAIRCTAAIGRLTGDHQY